MIHRNRYNHKMNIRANFGETKKRGLDENEINHIKKHKSDCIVDSMEENVGLEEDEIEVEEIDIDGTKYYVSDSGDIYNSDDILVGCMLNGIPRFNDVKHIVLPETTSKSIVLPETSKNIVLPIKEPNFDSFKYNDGGLNSKQSLAMEMFNSGQNIFLTGPGGVGKSHLIRQMVSSSRSSGKTFAVCAMTGCAAVQLKCCATTIHSWSGIRLAKDENWMIIQDVAKNKTAAARWKTVDILIVDEVSMMSKKIFELLDEMGRFIRKSSKPFGGIQVIFCGDFFQLPPVGNPEEPDTIMMCFESPQWFKTFPKCVELEQTYRQTDAGFVKILSEIRVGKITEESVTELSKCVGRKMDLDIVPTKLFPIKSKVEQINRTTFNRLPGSAYSVSYIAETNCITYTETNKPIDKETLKTCMKLSAAEKEREVKFLLSSIPPSEEVVFKLGAVVMCLVNLCLEEGICNGSVGVVVDVCMKNGVSIPIVRFRNGVKLIIDMHMWQSERYPSISIKQLPLMLAWAMTIHKGQGATMDVAEMDIGRSIFEYGQAYVGLSRVRTLDGLYLTDFNLTAIRADPKVVEFYEKIRG